MNDDVKIFKSVRSFIEYLTPTVLSIYFYSLGFFNNFSIPAKVDIWNSLYLFLSMIIDPISNLIWVYLFNKTSLILSIIIFFILIFYKKLSRYYGWKFKLPNNSIPSEVYIISMYFVLGFLISNLSHGDYFYWLKEPWLFFKANTQLYTARIIFVICSFYLIFIPVITIIIMEKTKTLFQNNYYKFILIVFSSLFSFSLTYKISYEYSGNFLKFPKFRQNSQSETFYKLIWKDNEEMYIFDCENHGKIKGIKDGKEFYSAYIDFEKHVGICGDN